MPPPLRCNRKRRRIRHHNHLRQPNRRRIRHTITSSAESPFLIHTKPEPEKPILSLPDFFSHAARKGIYFHVFLNEELAANPSGGIDQGASASQYLTFGTGIDLEQLIGWRGGALHAIVIALSSNPTQ